MTRQRTTRTRTSALAALAALAVVAGGAAVATPADAAAHHATAKAAKKHAKHRKHHRSTGRLPGGYKHLVVIYEENHSFDNLYGGWGSVGGQTVNGLPQATAAQKTQVGQDGTAYGCLPQDDVNLTSPPQPNTCQDATHGITASNFANAPFRIEDFIKPEDTTCPAPGVYAPNGALKGSGEPGGCTRDIVHRFYQEQYQIDGGKQDRYTTGSDAVGLTQGHYDTKALPIYRYLHAQGAPKYTIADSFFQAAFGGSFLNHQWLIAARSPLDTSDGGQGAKHSVLDSNGMPTTYPQYKADNPGVVDGQLTEKCRGTSADNYARACGAYAVNTVQPAVQPKSASGASIPLIDDAKYPNIGDRLSAKKVSWNWYSGGWDDANSGHPGPLFQYHHQPFNYFANYAPGQPGRAHLQDEKRFIAAAKKGTLPSVSFVKPYGAENEHPGYASESTGSDHLVDLLKTIRSGPEAKDTLVVVTYDEFGGQWDHVAPPQGDAWGPGTRIPALVIGGRQKKSGVDHTSYDTTSILATIERSFGLAPLSSRDAGVNDLKRAVVSRN
ncbi:acid phosphatase [Nocardioides korecus]